MRLIEIKQINGQIKLLSGLHIGAGGMQLHMGGADSPVVKNPFTGEPYIPGSSLKGKVRALLELKSGLMTMTEGRPLSVKMLSGISDEAKRVSAVRLIKLFGSAGLDSQALVDFGLTRASWSDCVLSKVSREALVSLRQSVLESKAEVSINRIRAMADAPRVTERVAPGVSFDFAISLKVFEGDESDSLEELLLEGLRLLAKDALGAGGSRGYGRVQIVFDSADYAEKFLACG